MFQENVSNEITSPKPYEDNIDVNAEHLLNEIDTVLNEIDDIIEVMNEDTDKSKNNTNDVILNEIISIIKEVLANETSILEEKLNLLNNFNEHIDEYAEDRNHENINNNEVVQNITTYARIEFI